MAITGRTTAEAAKQFAAKLNRVLTRTITERRVVQFTVDNAVSVGFRQAGKLVPAQLNTRFGPMALALSQRLGSVPSERELGRVELRTLAYRYALYADDSDPLVRWEYVRDRADPDAEWCRHHVQGTFALPFGSMIPANELHLPTGFVTIEEVIRFCVVDLECAPLRGEWSQVLDDSYREFKASFAEPS